MLEWAALIIPIIAIGGRNGTLDEDNLATRLTSLKIKTKQLCSRRDQLTDRLNDGPQPLPAATLQQVADHIAQIITNGTHNQRKTLIETLITEIKITAPDRIIPVFRIPQPAPTDATHNAQEALTRAKPQARASDDGVRAMTNLVGPGGVEPPLPGT